MSKKESTISNKTFFDTEFDNFRIEDSLDNHEEEKEIFGEDEEEDVEEEEIEDELEDEEQEEENFDDNEENYEEADEEESDDSEEDQESEEFSFSPLANHLNDSGILDIENIEDYEDSEEGFNEMINDTVNKKVEGILNSLSPKAQKLIELELNGGDFNELLRMEAIDYDDIDLEDEDNQRLLISNKLATEGYDADEIREKLQDIEDLNKLEKEAKIAHKYLAKKSEEQKTALVEQAKAEALAQEEKEEQVAEDFRKTVLNMTEIAGFKLTKREAERLYAYVAMPIGRDKTGKLITQYDRDNSMENRLKQAYFQMVDYNFSDVERKAHSNANLRIKKSLQNFQDKNNKSTTAPKPREVKQVTSIPNAWAGDINNVL